MVHMCRKPDQQAGYGTLFILETIFTYRGFTANVKKNIKPG